MHLKDKITSPNVLLFINGLKEMCNEVYAEV